MMNLGLTWASSWRKVGVELTTTHLVTTANASESELGHVFFYLVQQQRAFHKEMIFRSTDLLPKPLEWRAACS